MNYIIVVDNNKDNCKICRSMIFEKAKSLKLNDYKVAAWCDFANDNIDFNYECEQLIDELGPLFNSNNNVHLLIDLLLTNDEEERVGDLVDALTNKNSQNKRTATGINLANEILKKYNKNIKITFMSKWLDMQSGIEIREYNGIANNALWENVKLKSIFNPINENSKIVNRFLTVPRYGAKTVVDVLLNVALDLYQEE